MPVTRTATRALRKSKRKELHNKEIRAAVKNTVRDVKKAFSGKKDTDSSALLQKTYKILDKAAKENVIHENKAARLKSKLTRKLNSLSKTEKVSKKKKA